MIAEPVFHEGPARRQRQHQNQSQSSDPSLLIWLSSITESSHCQWSCLSTFPRYFTLYGPSSHAHPHRPPCPRRHPGSPGKPHPASLSSPWLGRASARFPFLRRLALRLAEDPVIVVREALALLGGLAALGAAFAVLAHDFAFGKSRVKMSISSMHPISRYFGGTSWKQPCTKANSRFSSTGTLKRQARVEAWISTRL